MPNFDDVFRGKLRRGYVHFDLPLSKKKTKNLVTSPIEVIKHGYYPFIQRVVSTPRYKSDINKVLPKRRTLAYAAHTDAAIFTWYNAILSEAYEEKLNDLSIGNIPVAYRKFPERRSNIHFANFAFEFINNNIPCVAIGLDIEGFFDNLDHNILYGSWKQVCNFDRLPDDHYTVYKRITNYAWVEEDELCNILSIKRSSLSRRSGRLCSPKHFREMICDNGLVNPKKTRKGIPQGSPMSAVLSNIYMLQFDIALSEYVKACGGFAQRYCDDIFVVVPIEKEEETIAFVHDIITERGLNIQAEKTDIVQFVNDGSRVCRPIQYLGLVYDGIDILIRSQTLSRYNRKVRSYLKKSGYQAIRNPKYPRIYSKKLNRLYSHKGKRNFITYAYRCAKLTNSKKIRKQIKNHSSNIKSWSEEMLERQRRSLIRKRMSQANDESN